MISKFKSIVISTVGSRDMKDVYNYEEKVRDIEKKLDRGEIDLSGAMSGLLKLFRYHLSSDDYRKIEKETGYNVK